MEELPKKRKLFYIAIPYLLILAGFFSVEIWARATHDSISTLALFTGGNFERKVEVLPGRGQQIFEGDALLGWKLMSNLKQVHWDFTTFSTNRQGIRYDKDVGSKDNNTFRIIALGDSVTFGYRVPTTQPDNPLEVPPGQLTYTQLLELYLKQNNPDKNMEVMPMAIPGYTSYQGLKWLKRDIDVLKPDLVITLFGWNDTEMHKQSDKEALPDTWLKFAARNLLSKSQALIYSNRWFKEKEESQKLPEDTELDLKPRVSKDDFIKNILAINELAMKYGAKNIVIGTLLRDAISETEQSNRIAEYRAELAKVMSEKNIPYLEIEVLTEAGYPDNYGLFGELIHPNHLGHQIIAEEIIKLIREKNIFEGNSVNLPSPAPSPASNQDIQN